MSAKRIVLVGAGHAHMLLLRDGRFLAARPTIILIDATGRFVYSGLATGVLGGMYESALDTVEVEPLVRRVGGRLIIDRVSEVDRDSKRVELTSGASVAYDFVSFNIGSESNDGDIDGAREHAWTVKPIESLFRLREAIETRFAARSDEVSAVVIGGGPTGCEVAANLVDLARRHEHAIAVSLVHSGSRLLLDWSKGAAASILDELESAGVTVRLDSRVDLINSERVDLQDGRSIPAEFVVLANGLCPPGLFRRGGFRVDDDGALLTRRTLQAVDDDHVFGVGDCAAIAGEARPRLGVFAVRATPVLRDNLFALMNDRPLRQYQPQKRYLSVINLGRGRGLAIRGSCYWRGRRAMDLKDRIDRRFLSKLRTPDS
ncbi:MAG: NAD(P)/FAD-dependent oxidoreductase [Phycisphaerales bacterium]